MRNANLNPKVSIIVPIYNVEKYLSQCLDSLIRQTYPNIQILCVNDGSPDGSREIVQKYAEMDERIVCIDKPNGGLSSARNHAHAYVDGEYIMYLDSDDWIEPNTCELAVHEAVTHEADVVCWNYVREIGAVSKPKIILGEERIIFSQKSDVAKLHRRFLGLYKEELRHPENANSLDTAWGKLYSADIILNNHIEFVDTKIIGTEDALFNLYVFGFINKVVYIPECLNHYRRDNETSLTKTYKKDLQQQWIKLHNYMRNYVDEKDLDESYSVALNNRISLSIIGLGLNIVRAGNEIRKINEIKSIISDKSYKKASKDLMLAYFPFHWKLFFWGAKHGMAMLTYCLLCCIRKMKGN